MRLRPWEIRNTMGMVFNHWQIMRDLRKLWVDTKRINLPAMNEIIVINCLCSMIEDRKTLAYLLNMHKRTLGLKISALINAGVIKKRKNYRKEKKPAFYLASQEGLE